MPSANFKVHSVPRIICASANSGLRTGSFRLGAFQSKPALGQSESRKDIVEWLKRG